LIVTLVCVAILVYAYGIAAMTEFHTDRVRRLIERAIGLPGPRSALASDPAQIAQAATDGAARRQ
jgi:hypothetical protein